MTRDIYWPSWLEWEIIVHLFSVRDKFVSGIALARKGHCQKLKALRKWRTHDSVMHPLVPRWALVPHRFKLIWCFLLYCTQSVKNLYMTFQHWTCIHLEKTPLDGRTSIPGSCTLEEKTNVYSMNFKQRCLGTCWVELKKLGAWSQSGDSKSK